MQNRSYTRVNNKGKILELIRKTKSIYRAELARLTELSMPTIMSITDELVAEGLIRDAGKGISSGGKPPMLLELIPDSRLFVGIDISGAMFKCVILDLQGDVTFHRAQERDELPEEPLISSIINFIQDTISESNVNESKIFGIGVGIPGLVDTETGVVITSIDYDCKNTDLRSPLQAYFKKAVFIENSSKVMAIGEKWFGAGDGCDDFALVTVGRGIGAALIIKGEIYNGFYNKSGEIGHMVINPNGPLCKCGKRGCLETLASGNAIKNQARQLVDAGGDSTMLKMAGGNNKKINSDIVFAAAEQGDPLARLIADSAIDNLAIGLNNLVCLFDCQRIILTGYVVKNNKYLLQHVSEKINATRSLYYGNMPIDVRLSVMGEEAAVIGAATLALQSFGTGVNISI